MKPCREIVHALNKAYFKLLQVSINNYAYKNDKFSTNA